LVHETRKAVKRMRALARLLREQLGESEFTRVDASLRDAGRRLAGSRDADVRLATLRELIERYPKALAPSRAQTRKDQAHNQAREDPGHEGREHEDREHDRQAREGIRRLQEQLQRECLHSCQPSDTEQVLRDIAAMRDQLARWSLVDHDFDTLAPGLQRIYREGRHRYARCKREQGREERDMHDWRKRVKSLYYALDMLGAKQAQGGRRITRRANRLGDLLGNEHDLWLLRTYVEDHPEAFAEDAAAKAALLELIEQRRRRLRKRALALGGRLYRRKPGKLTRRIGRALAD
jgi:CHAD domain-containing protein